MRILGIETSCDETAAAVVEDGVRVRSNVVASSVKDQAIYGGVFPEVAARRQIEYIIPVVNQALLRAKVSPHALDAIAVTKGPGLLTSLLVGVVTARSLAAVWRKPLIGIHHTLGHLDSPWLEEPAEILFPVLTLSVSGGHTDLWLRKRHTEQTLLGRTLDDAAGEAFDKGAVQLGLPYPGGPALALLAEGGNPQAIEFPHPLASEHSCNFSFSGLKTALKYTLRDRGGLSALSAREQKDLAASYQEAICAHLLSRIALALSLSPEARELHVVGGVSANLRLRELLAEYLQENAPHMTLRMPKKFGYCTDNAAMIAAAGEFLTRERGQHAFVPFKTEASVTLGL